jgi:iron complex outermembrane receptor protein
MAKKSILIVLFTVLAASQKFMFCQTHPTVDTSQVIELGEVQVSVARTLVNRNQVPLTVSVVSRPEIESSSESSLLPVLAEHVPGMFVTERGVTGFGVAAGAAGQISLRGIGGSPNTQVLVLLNGNPQFMGIMGHPLPDAYVASDVEKVEVIRGPASTLYGTNAMGGVINIITRQQDQEGFKANARLMYGMYNTQKYMINGGFRKKKLEVFASFNHDQTDGHRDSSDFRISNGYGKIKYALNKHIDLGLDMSLARFEASDPGPENSVAGQSIDINRGMGSFFCNNMYAGTEGSLRVFYNFGEHKITDGFHSTDFNYGMIIYQSFKIFKGNTITLGLDYKHYGGLAENTLAMSGEGMVFGDTSVWDLAGYAYLQQQLGQRLVVNAGFRMEHHSVYGQEPVPTLGLAFHPARFTTLKASIAKGFRSPTIRELYLWKPANEDLKPERMVNYELGVTQKFFKNRIYMELTYFRSEGNNLIYTVMGPSGPKNQNTGSFMHTGMECSAGYNDHIFSLRTNYSFLYSKEPTLATPRQQINISISKTWKQFNLSISMQHVQKLYTQITPTAQSENYTIFNSKAAYRISKFVEVFAKGENLLNQKYSINFGYPMPGVLVFGGVQLHL